MLLFADDLRTFQALAEVLDLTRRSTAIFLGMIQHSRDVVDMAIEGVFQRKSESLV